MSDTEDCPPPFPEAHPSEPEVTAEVAAPADPSPLEIRPVPASSAPTTPEVILYLRENFGMLSKTLEREVFRKGMITATVDEMLGRFTSQLGDLYQKVLLELGEEAMTVEMRAILLRTLQPSCNEGTAMVVDVLQSHILGVDGQFCALFNRDYLDDAVTMAHQVLDRNGPRDGNRPAVGDSPPTLNGANKSDAARHDGNPFCLDYENGRCTRGSSCRYRHEPLHDDMLLRGGQGATETTADFPSRPIVVLPHQMHHHHHHSQQPVHHHLHASQPQPMPTNSLSPASFSPTQVVVGRVPAGSALSSVKVLPQQPQFGSPSPSMSVPPPNSGFMQNAHPGYPSGRGGTPPAPGTPLPHSTHHIHHHHHSPTGHASPPPQHPMLAPLAHQHHMHNMHHHQHQHQHHILQPPQQQPQHNTLQGAVPHNFVAQPQALRHHHHHLHHHNNQQPLPSHPTHHIHHIHHHHHHHQSNHGPSGTNALQDAHLPCCHPQRTSTTTTITT